MKSLITSLLQLKINGKLWRDVKIKINKNTWIIVGIVIVSLLIRGIDNEQKEVKKVTTATDVVRSFASTDLYQGESVSVTYTPTAGDWTLDEILPDGWTVQGVTIFQQHLREYLSQSTPVTYTFIAPPTLGDNLFNQGTFQMGVIDQVWYKFTPDVTITVSACSGGTLTCDGEDNDCDHLIDEADELTSPPLCILQNGVCAGSTKPCSGSWQSCTSTQYGPNYEATESICDALDNDCDSSVNEGMIHVGSLNTLQNGVCAGSQKSCNAGSTSWFDDYSGVDDYIATEDASPSGTPALCDALDNDCDGDLDEPKMNLITDTSGDGDIDCSGCIENSEFTTYKNAWKTLGKTNPQFTELKNKWKTLEGC